MVHNYFTWFQADSLNQIFVSYPNSKSMHAFPAKYREWVTITLKNDALEYQRLLLHAEAEQ
ncbi:hypothetical protein BM1_06455 [Bipolaris maydis]|nr:hypothetical protein BM1_06455 [Bipolaris maydis]